MEKIRTDCKQRTFFTQNESLIFSPRQIFFLCIMFTIAHVILHCMGDESALVKHCQQKV